MRWTSVPTRLTSTPDHLVCPACGYGALRPRGTLSRSAYYCEESCWCAFGGGVPVGTLEQLEPPFLTLWAKTPPARSAATPKMRSLAEGTFYCPACRSEVVPTTDFHLCALVSHAEEDGEQKELVGFRRDRRDGEGRAGLVEDYS